MVSFIYRLTLTVTLLQNTILPTTSSKVVKYLISSGQLLPSVRPLVFSRDKYKLVFISNLAIDGKRVIKRREASENSFLKLPSHFLV